QRRPTLLALQRQFPEPDQVGKYRDVRLPHEEWLRLEPGSRGGPSAVIVVVVDGGGFLVLRPHLTNPPGGILPEASEAIGKRQNPLCRRLCLGEAQEQVRFVEERPVRPPG